MNEQKNQYLIGQDDFGLNLKCLSLYLLTEFDLSIFITLYLTVKVVQWAISLGLFSKGISFLELFRTFEIFESFVMKITLFLYAKIV